MVWGLAREEAQPRGGGGGGGGHLEEGQGLVWLGWPGSLNLAKHGTTLLREQQAAARHHFLPKQSLVGLPNILNTESYKNPIPRIGFFVFLFVASSFPFESNLVGMLHFFPLIQLSKQGFPLVWAVCFHPHGFLHHQVRFDCKRGHPRTQMFVTSASSSVCHSVPL